MIRLRPSGVDEILIKRVQDWYEPGPGVFIQSLTASFSPAQLFTGSTTGVWYDPSDTTTLFQDAAGTTPVTAVEQPVGLMLDKSGRGNHAFQSSSANRPTLSARYNLLTKTEQFDDAAWTKTAGVTVTDNAAVAPDGTTTATTIAFGGFGREIAQSFSATTAITTPTFYVKGTAGQVLNFGAAGVDRSITLTGGWDIATSTLPAGIAKLYIGNYSGSANALNISIWHPDLRVANDALNQPAYQRVNTSTDYDTVGFKPYLRFNGTNQWLQTNSIDFTYTDKMFVSAGVRKLQESGASAQLICELSADAGTNNGGFYLTGWNGYQSPNHRYAMSSRGTASATSAETSASYAAPITNVISGIGNISGDQAILRVNGSQAAISTADQGTGNCGNYSLYIGARAGSSLWFNGRLYSLIVAGKQASAAEITSTETYINQRTGAY